jgi:hypothetical protein
MVGTIEAQPRKVSSGADFIFAFSEPMPEPDGDELAGDKEARKHVEMIAQEMSSNRSRYKRGLEHWAFVVTDEAGRQVAVVPFSDRSQIMTSSKSK